MPSNADVVVVGDGVFARSVAYRLSMSGRRVVRIAPIGVEGSATLASGAMLGVLGEVTSGEDPLDVNLRVRGDEAFRRWADQDVVPQPQLGTFLIVGSDRPSDLAAAEEAERAAARHALPCETVDPADVPGLEPRRRRRPSRVLHLAREGRVSPSEVLAMLVERGADQVIDSEALAIEHSAGRVAGVRTASGLTPCDEVVVCAGAGTQNLLQASGLGAELMPPVVVAKGVGLVLEQRTNASLDHVLRTPNRDFACGLHLVPRAGSFVYVGATNRASRHPQVLGRSTAGEVTQILDGAATELHAGLDGWDIVSVHWGHRVLSADGRPIVGRTELTGLSVATAGYRNGVLLAPLIAELLQAELDGAESDPLLTPQRRFGPPSPQALLEQGIDDLVELLGREDWAARARDIFRVLAEAAAGQDEKAAALQRELASGIRRGGRPEMLPEALVELVAVRDELTSPRDSVPPASSLDG